MIDMGIWCDLPYNEMSLLNDDAPQKVAVRSCKDSVFHFERSGRAEGTGEFWHLEVT